LLARPVSHLNQGGIVAARGGGQASAQAAAQRERRALVCGAHSASLLCAALADP